MEAIVNNTPAIELTSPYFALIQEDARDKLEHLVREQPGVLREQHMGYNGLQFATQQDRRNVIPVLAPHLSGSFAKNGCTSLMIALLKRHYDAAAELLQLETGLQNQKTGDSALMVACVQRNVKFILQLYPLEAKLQNMQQTTALMLCVNFDIQEMLKHPQLLLQEVRMRDQHGKTALCYAVRNSRVQFIDFLVKYELDITDNQGQTALMLAVTYNCNHVFAGGRIAFESELGHQDDLGETALIKAINQGNIVLAMILCKHEASLRDLFHLLPLHHLFAAYQRLTEKVPINPYLKLVKQLMSSYKAENIDTNCIKSQIPFLTEQIGRLSVLQRQCLSAVRNERLGEQVLITYKSPLFLFLALNRSSILDYEDGLLAVVGELARFATVVEDSGETAIYLVLDYLHGVELPERGLNYIERLLEKLRPGIGVPFREGGRWISPLGFCLSNGMYQLAMLLVRTFQQSLSYTELSFDGVKIPLSQITSTLIEGTQLDIDSELCLRRDDNGVRVNDILMLPRDAFQTLLGSGVRGTEIYQHPADF